MYYKYQWGQFIKCLQQHAEQSKLIQTDHLYQYVQYVQWPIGNIVESKKQEFMLVYVDYVGGGLA